MKLIINSTALIPPVSGIGRYTQNLLKCLLNPLQFDKGEIEKIQACTPLSFYEREDLQQLINLLDNEQSQDKLGHSLVKLKKIKNIVKRMPGGNTLKRALQQHLIRKKLAPCTQSIYWEPNYILEKFNGVSIPTVYDLSHIRYPQFHPVERRRWLDNNLIKTLDKAAAVITISEFSKREIIDNFSIEPNRITIIPPAVSDEFRQVHTDLQKEEVRRHYKLPERYILSVGTIEPRKNLAGLLAAFEELPTSLKVHCPLVIVGCSGWLSENIEQVLQPLVQKKQVIRLGYVPQHHLPILFSTASLFVYISHYEGYGMPVAEAMSSGVPVITSNISSMPEVAANCATLVDPNDKQQIAQEIQELIANSTKRGEQIIKAKKQSDNYIWEDSAKKLVNLFQQHAP